MTTIAGGKSNVAGYSDGPSEDAKFSTDFDVVYVPSTCSLLVVDRGNAALRQISLNQEDCDANNSFISASGEVYVICFKSTFPFVLVIFFCVWWVCLDLPGNFSRGRC